MSDLRTSQKAQNLARIRDNQRRSRARRKEYLQELETKLRSCEQVGIEASSEIQSAARRVLDENRKLRALLHERGVSEPEVVVALGGPPDRPYEQISSAPTLNAMLERRITCNMVSSTSSPTPSHTRASSMPRHLPSVPPITIPAPRPTALSCCDSPSPSSMVSSMGTPPPASYSTSFYTAPMTPSAAEMKADDVRYNYPYEQPYNNSWTYSNDYNYVTEPVTYYSTSSCVDAANIIRTMRSDVGPELEADLGCRAPEQHCYVNNNVVFNMMDKYATPHTAI
ncbi:Nn.00g113020.m01.CDS01 [Neocucurbitaria sp. VM-36]